jgi:NADH/NAD ratio-sensing transcriptional regulator Rex
VASQVDLEEVRDNFYLAMETLFAKNEKGVGYSIVVVPSTIHSKLHDLSDVKITQTGVNKLAKQLIKSVQDKADCKLNLKAKVRRLS